MSIFMSSLAKWSPLSASFSLSNVMGPGFDKLSAGLNGSGKSTFLNVLLRYVQGTKLNTRAHWFRVFRLYDFDGGTFRINDVDVRSYAPGDLHAHTSAVFQDFSQFNASLRENVGVGCIQDMKSDLAIEQALEAGGGSKLLEKLPDGLESVLDDGFSFSFGAMNDRRSLSGGEVSQALFLLRQRQNISSLMILSLTVAKGCHLTSVYADRRRSVRVRRGE